MFYNDDKNNNNGHHNIPTYNTTEWRNMWMSHTADTYKKLDGAEEILGRQMFNTT
jgi:hypothetical protein